MARALVRSSEASATGQSPSRSAASSASVIRSTRGAPGGAIRSATTAPDWMTNVVCGPGSPVTAQSSRLGAHPAIDSARSR